MQSVLQLFVPSFSGCMLVASWVFGFPAVPGALAGPGAVGPPEVFLEVGRQHEHGLTAVPQREDAPEQRHVRASLLVE
jgi:hypothetical protein